MERGIAAVLFEAAGDDVYDGKVAGLVWAPGFVREATLATQVTADVGELLAVTRRFLASPVAEFVRGLNFSLSYAGWAAEARAVTRARHPELINALRFDASEAGAQLRELDAGDFGEVSELRVNVVEGDFGMR